MGSAQSLGSSVGQVQGNVNSVQINSPATARKFYFYICLVIFIITSIIYTVSIYNKNTNLPLNSPDRKTKGYFIGIFIGLLLLSFVSAWVVGWFTEFSGTQRLTMVNTICEKQNLVKDTPDFNQCVISQYRFLEQQDSLNRIERNTRR